MAPAITSRLTAMAMSSSTSENPGAFLGRLIGPPPD